MHSEKLNCHRLTFHKISSGHQRVNFNHTRAMSHAELRSHPHDSVLQSNFFNLIRHVRAARLLTLPNDDSMSKNSFFCLVQCAHIHLCFSAGGYFRWRDNSLVVLVNVERF